MKLNIDTDFKTRRFFASVTLKDVSEATGINISLLSRYENGKVTPGLKNLIKIDDFLKEKIKIKNDW